MSANEDQAAAAAAATPPGAPPEGWSPARPQESEGQGAAAEPAATRTCGNCGGQAVVLDGATGFCYPCVDQYEQWARQQGGRSYTLTYVEGGEQLTEAYQSRQLAEAAFRRSRDRIDPRCRLIPPAYGNRHHER
jgi:hypothetical protein